MHNETTPTSTMRLSRFPRERYVPKVLGHRGLTHVSRLIRHEFLTIYNTRFIYVEIDIRDIYHFITTFFDLHDRQSLIKLTGTIEVSLDRGTSGLPTKIDLLPLMKLMVLAPNLQARFVTISYIRRTGMPDFVYPTGIRPYVHDLCRLLRRTKIERPDMRESILHDFEN
jgi:hypothetical protein